MCFVRRSQLVLKLSKIIDYSDRLRICSCVSELGFANIVVLYLKVFQHFNLSCFLLQVLVCWFFFFLACKWCINNWSLSFAMNMLFMAMW